MSKKKPFVSVIMASYNHALWIEESICSVLYQTYNDFEMIIVDDGSTDNSLDVIKKLAKQDERINYFPFRENKGAVAAANYGLSKANGKYVAMINSDDMWFRTKLAKQVQLLEERDDLAAVFGMVKLIDADGNETKHIGFDVFNVENRSRHMWLNHFFKTGNCLCLPSVLIRKSVYDSVGFFDERLRNFPDFHMWVKVCMKYNIHIMREELVKFRVHTYNESNPENISAHIRCNTEYMTIYDEFLNINDIEELKKIFPEFSQEMTLLDNKLVPFYLANFALKRNFRFSDIWGVRELYKILCDDYTRNLLNESKVFTNNDFYNLVTEKNICDISIHTKPQLLEQIKLLENKKTNLEQEKINLEQEKTNLEQEKTNLGNAKQNLELQLQTIKGSRAWRLMCKYYKIRDKVLPIGTKRRKYVLNVKKSIYKK